MKIDLSYKQCCIIKHALQNQNRNLAEEILYRMMSTIVARESDHRTEIVHGDIPCGKRNRILKLHSKPPANAGGFFYGRSKRIGDRSIGCDIILRWLGQDAG